MTELPAGPSLHADEVFTPQRPWLYPGRPLADGCVLGLRADGGDVALAHRPGTALGDAVVGLGGDKAPLDEMLRSAGASTLHERRPVASYGSNCDPGVLRRKLAAGGVSGTVPLLPGRLRNARLAASAHVSRPGYIPAAAMRSDGAELPVVVAWLDSAQLRCVDATEVNYDPLVPDSSVHELRLDSGERLDGATLYGTMWGVISTGPEGFASQGDVWRRALAVSRDLCALLSIDPNVPHDRLRSAMEQLATDESLRVAARECLVAVAVPSGVQGTHDAGRHTSGPHRSTA